jgi:hypothetical protein
MYLQTDAATAPEPGVVVRTAARRRGLTRPGFFALAFLVASFAYEIPLAYVSGFYKANPYLFDLAFLNLVAYWLVAGRVRGWKVSLRSNPILPPWTAVTLCFVFATLVAGTWVPANHYIKSLWYCLKYVEGYLALLIAFSAPIDERAKRGLLWVALLGGTWVAFYAVLQLAGVVSTVRVIPRGTEILPEGFGIYSTLGVSYLHSGFFGLLSALVGLAVFQSSRGAARVAAAILAPFAAIPAVVSGARAAFLGLLISLGVLAFQPQYRTRLATYLMGGVLAAVIAFTWAQGVTKARSDTDRGERSAVYRVLHGPRTIAALVEEHGPLLLLAGGGFMVVPLHGVWRAGFGVHNIHLLPLEQAGVGAFVAALWLWVRTGTRLGRRPRDGSATPLDEQLRLTMFAFFVAVVVVGLSGSSFWVFSFNEHFAFYEVLALGLGMTTTGAAGAEARRALPQAELAPEPLGVPAWEPSARA